jgi:beta-glucosidase
VGVSLTIRNSGARAGNEVVQLYIRDVLASVARPIQELRGFQRVFLRPGTSQRVTFVLHPADLSMLDSGLQRVVEPGAFRIMVGASSRDIRLRGILQVR